MNLLNFRLSWLWPRPGPLHPSSVAFISPPLDAKKVKAPSTFSWTKKDLLSLLRFLQRFSTPWSGDSGMNILWREEWAGGLPDTSSVWGLYFLATVFKITQVKLCPCDVITLKNKLFWMQVGSLDVLIGPTPWIPTWSTILLQRCLKLFISYNNLAINVSKWKMGKAILNKSRPKSWVLLVITKSQNL